MSLNKFRPSHKATWIEQIDFAARLYNLDPELPVIKQLWQKREQYKWRGMNPMSILRMLNPDLDVRKNIDGSIVIDSRTHGWILPLEVLVRHHLLYRQITTIEASNRSITLYAPDGRLLAEISGTAIDPMPYLDPSIRYGGAYQLLEALTSIPLQSQEYFQRNRRLSFSWDQDESLWSLKVTAPVSA